MEETHIGEIIEKVFKDSGMTKKALAEKIGYSRNNIYNIFTRKTLDIGLLKKLGEVLNYDFVELRPTTPGLVEEQPILYKKEKKSKIKLVIELDPDEDILMNEKLNRKLKELMKIVS